MFKKLFILSSSILLSFIFVVKTFGNSKEQNETLVNKERVIKNCSFYKWFDPNTNEKEGKELLKNCSSCHAAYYNEWTNDKHSMSQNNPFFLSMYKDFRKDHPDKNGNCSLCHNPEAAIDNGFDVDLRKQRATKTNGISCDFCHKIEDVDQNDFKKGVTGLSILKICKGMKDIRIGSIKDPIQISNKEELRYNSLYKTSLYCAKCHEGSNGNIKIYSTFSEWLNSPAAKKGVQCQTCHMPVRESEDRDQKLEIVDNPNINHKQRPYYEIHSHGFLTKEPHEFRKKYVDLNLAVALRNNVISNGYKIITVTCTVENNNFGHSFPTGSPMRNAILVLEAKDKNGNDLKLIKGSLLPNYAENLKGKPGKLFAKILSETSSEYAATHGNSGIRFRKIANKLGIPAQDWWNVFIANDTRIKANEKDISVYEFTVGASRDLLLQPVTITAKLVWRNTWAGLAKLKDIDLKEDLLIKKELSL